MLAVEVGVTFDSFSIACQFIHTKAAPHLQFNSTLIVFTHVFFISSAK